ncbi:MAG: hypothetical protein NPINA01_02710 [Nitrospinaceae bacterium]|nr:MAG: hypothetical protein NPINA01_02710 [Nitrospinaceae bacterium]
MKSKSIIALVIAGSLALIVIVNTVAAFPILKPTAQMRCIQKNHNLVGGFSWHWVPAKWITLNGKKVYIAGFCKRGVEIPH